MQPFLQLLGAAGAVVVDGALELEAPLVDAGPRDDNGLATVGVDALVDLQLRGAARVEAEEAVRRHVDVDEAEGQGGLLGIGHLGHAGVLHALARVDEVGGDVATGQAQAAKLVLEVVEDLLALLLVGEARALALLHRALELREQLGSCRVEQDGAGAHDLHSKVIHYGPSSGKFVTAGLLRHWLGLSGYKKRTNYAQAYSPSYVRFDYDILAYHCIIVNTFYQFFHNSQITW